MNQLLHVHFLYLVSLDLQPEEHIVLEEAFLQGDKVLELQTSDGVQQDPSKQQDLFRGTHPQPVSLQPDGGRSVWMFKLPMYKQYKA